MEYRILGKTGLKVSRLGLGGIPIQRIDAAGTKALVHQLMEAGVNYIDTARGYSVSEEFLGEALEGIRDRFILASKSMSRSYDAMAQDIAASLQNLRTDYIDLYQIHNPTKEELFSVTRSNGALQALLQAKAEGRIGHIGITAHSDEVFRLALNMDWVETIMFPYNIVETQGEELIRAAAEKNIGFIAMKPLAGGAIEDAGLALRFLLNNPDVTIAIPGMAEAGEAEQNLAAEAQFSPLTEEDMEQIQTIRQTLGTQFCRRCNYCAPCSVGIPIPNVFLMQGYLTRYGLEDWARSRYQALPVKASACINCGVCETSCPYQLPIRHMLRLAAVQFGK